MSKNAPDFYLIEEDECMKLVRNGVLFFVFFAATQAFSQVVEEFITVDGVSVGIQKLTLECPFFNFDSGWEAVPSKYSIHLMDIKRAPKRPRVEAHGFYSHHQKKWFEFEDVSENEIVLSDLKVPQYWASSGKESAGTCANGRQYIDRNTLDIVFEFDKVPRSGTYQERPFPQTVWNFTCGGEALKRLQVVVVKKSCTVLKYERPPVRLGF